MGGGGGWKGVGVVTEGLVNSMAKGGCTWVIYLKENSGKYVY